MHVLDLFSGIGGFSLGLERAGMRTVAFAEIDPFCRRVLAMHWPGVPIYDDVRTVTADRLRADGVAADVVCGGFPCQDISLAGKGAGIAGERSGLWVEFARIIGEVRPRFAIVENVAALTARGLRTVLGDLAEIGYDAEWHCIPASAVGAPHRRDRIWIIAYPDADGQRQPRERQPEHCVIEGASGREPDGLCPGGRRDGPAVADADGTRLSAPELAPVLGARRWNEGRAAAERGWWRAEPAVGRVADGVPLELDFARGLTDEQGDRAKAIAAGHPAVGRLLRAVWEHRDAAAASRNLYIARLRSAVPDLPRGDPNGRWLLGPRIEAHEGLRDLWSAFHAKPLQEAQDLQRRLLERAWEVKRPQALGGRVDRLRSLGNAVVPQIPEIIGRAIMSQQGEL